MRLRSPQILDNLKIYGLWLDVHEEVSMSAAIFRSNDKNLVDFVSVFVSKPAFFTNPD